jgi:hypothetical protein
MSTKATTPEIISLASTFSADEQAAIANFAGVTIDHPSFLPYLGIASHLGLSPLLGEIWLIETQTFDRSTGQWVAALRPAVGRDGFLKVARRSKNVMVPPRSNVVCANDYFKFTDKGGDVEIEHSVTLAGSDEENELAHARGPVLGAWAKLYYRDRTPPFFYYAPIEEHGKRGPTAQDGDEPVDDWIGAWSYTHAMIAKCAQSYVLRIGASITGVVPADEIHGIEIIGGGAGNASKARSVPADSEGIVHALENVSDETKEKLVAALARVNELSPFSWATAKVSVVLAEADEEAAKGVLTDIEREIEKLEKDEVRA